MRLDHIALIVSKEENIVFYENLGFKKTKKIERDYDSIIFMECDDITLEVFVDPKHPERLNNPESKGLRHVAFMVDDIEKYAKNNINTDFFGRRFTFIKDLDNQPIELVEKGNK